MTSTTATARPSNLRAYRKAEANLTEQLAHMRRIVESFDRFLLIDTVIPEPVADAWNAAHDAVTALECELRQVELDGYGKPRELTELAKLVAANID